MAARITADTVFQIIYNFCFKLQGTEDFFLIFLHPTFFNFYTKKYKKL